MADKAFDIPWPTAGLNLDAPPSELASNEAYELQNMLVSESEVRMRAPIDVIADDYGNLMSSNDSDAIISCRMVNNACALTLVEAADRTALGQGSHYYVDDVQAATPAGNIRVLYNSGFVDGTGTWVATTTGGLDNNRTIGRDVVLQNSSYGISFEPFTDGYNRYGAASLTGPQLVQWAGANGGTVITTTGANINVGDQSVTLSATVPTDLTGYIFTAGTGSSFDNQRWNYVIKEHTPGDASFMLDAPWGYGDPSVTTFTSGGLVLITTQSRVFQAPVGCSAVGAYKSRVFVGRGFVTYASGRYQYYPNAIFWSYPNNPSYWPTNNYIIVDNDDSDPIVALVDVPEGLLIFMRRKTYLLTGFDESSFAIHKVSNTIGALHSQGTVRTNNGCAWVSELGVFEWQGGRISNLSAPSASRGVSYGMQNDYRDVMLYGQTPYNNPTYFHELPSMEEFDDKYFVHYGSIAANQTHDIWVFDRKTSAWSTMTIGDGDSVDRRKLQLLAKTTDGKLVVMSQEASYNLTQCFDPTWRFDTSNGRYSEADLVWELAGGGGLESSIIQGAITQIVKPAANDTVRLRTAEAYHVTQWKSPNTTQLHLYQVGITANFGQGTESSIGYVKARPYNSVVADFTRPYCDRFTLTTAPNEAHLFSVRITTGAAIASLTSSRFTKLRLYFDPQTVRQGWVDPTAEAQ